MQNQLAHFKAWPELAFVVQVNIETKELIHKNNQLEQNKQDLNQIEEMKQKENRPITEVERVTLQRPEFTMAEVTLEKASNVAMELTKKFEQQSFNDLLNSKVQEH